MKIQIPTTTQRRDGGALILTAIILVIVGAVLATYLLITESEYTAVARSQTWNSAMVLTEAGVEEGMAFINKYSGNWTMVPQWSSPSSASADGWTVSGNLYTKTQIVNSNMGYYTVTIDNTISNAPIITSVGTAYWNQTTASAAPPFMLASGGVSMPVAPTKRSVQVQAIYTALFPGAMTTQTNINMNGNNVRVDSFDSTLTNLSAWNTNWGYGVYDVTKAHDHGTVATDSTMTDALSIGNANIYGHVNTGPGGTVYVKNNGYVGPLPQQGSGIVSGWANDDMNQVFPSVVAPTGVSGWSTVSDGGTINSSGNYYISSINSGLTINAPNVQIYVAGSISLSGQESINLTTNAANVAMYVAGPSFALSGQATINNQTQRAMNFGIYGLPTLTSINFGGNAGYTGTIYAPQAAFSFGGGGNNTYDFVGSLVAFNVTLNGHSNFHYDESLARMGPGIGYVPTYWKEIHVTSN